MAFAYPPFSAQYPNFPTFNQPTIDACITQCKTLTDELNTLYARIYKGEIPSNQDLDKEYRRLEERIHAVTRDLKPAAMALCNQMIHQEALPIKNALEAACGTLKSKHRNLLHQITELVHENKIEFPVPPEPNCACSKTKAFFVRNRGWIFSATALAFGIASATPAGTYLGPTLKKMPRFFGELCKDIGDTVSQFLSGGTLETIATSKWMQTAGRISLAAATIYPTYWYFKEPFAEFRKKSFEKVDNALTLASNYPIRTVLISWAAFYTLFRSTGFEGEAFEWMIEKTHAKIFSPLVPALCVPTFIETMKNLLDSYKNSASPPMLSAAPAPSNQTPANPQIQKATFSVTQPLPSLQVQQPPDQSASQNNTSPEPMTKNGEIQKPPELSQPKRNPGNDNNLELLGTPGKNGAPLKWTKKTPKPKPVGIKAEPLDLTSVFPF